MMSLSRRGGPGLLTHTALVVTAGSAAAACLIGVFIGDKRQALPLVGAIVLLVSFALAKNQRLFCLWGLLLTAPLSVMKQFLVIPHMGGAGSLPLELPDIFIALLLAFLVRDIARGYRGGLRLSPIAFWWGALTLLGVVSIVTGPFRQLPALEVVRMIKEFLLFLVIINELIRVRQFLHAFAALAAGVAMEGALAIVQYFYNSELGLQFLGEAPPEAFQSASLGVYLTREVFRVGALIGHPNMLSAYLALLLPICFAMLLSRIGVLAKMVLCGVIGLGLTALVMTLSRSGWLSFGIAFLLLFAASFLHPRLRTRYVMARVVMIGCIVAGLLAFSGAIEKRLTQSDPGAVKFRYEFMEISWDMIPEHPILGFGLNTYVFDLPGRTKYGGASGITQQFGKIWPVVHNIWLLTWVEQGTVGFLFFVGFNLCIIWLGLGNARHFIDDVPFMINLGAVTGCIAIMVDGMSSFFIRDPACGRVFFIAVGLIVAVRYWNMAQLRLVADQRAARMAAAAPRPAAAPPPAAVPAPA